MIKQYKKNPNWKKLFLEQDSILEAKAFKKSYACAIIQNCFKEPLLDAGTGNGRIAGSFLLDGIDAYGIDIDSDMICKLKKIWPKHFFCIDAKKTKFQDSFFGTVISPGVIEHFYKLNDQKKLISETARILKKGGCLYLWAPAINPIARITNYFKKSKNSLPFWQYRYGITELICLIESTSQFKVLKYWRLGLRCKRPNFITFPLWFVHAHKL